MPFPDSFPIAHLALGFSLTCTLMLGAGAARPAQVIVDKTLVAWVQPANLTQHGGSALTLEDGSDHFDGIVFGELAPAKWMAGSNFYERTQRNQSAVPAETDTTGLVQVAIVYRGRQVSLYRNGALISAYEISAAQRDFGPDSIVLFGKRHRRQGDNAHFAGAISDARIYDRALDAAEIASLQPKRQSPIPPWAWWTFDNPSGTDRTHRFRYARLTGGAVIRQGRLVLDGRDGALECRAKKEPPFVAETPTLPSPVPSTWLTFHLAHPGPGVAMPGDPNCAFYWKGEYHLHYIYNNQAGFSFAHVSSKDLVHWTWHRTVLTPPNTGHGMFSGTGFFTKEGRPAIIYHGQGSGRNQIALALDDRLDRWSKPMAIEPEIPAGADASLIAHWDPDAWLEGDTYYALSGGSPGSGKPPTLFRSSDLRKWTYLGRFLDHDMPGVQPDEDISCPNFFRIGDKRMLLCISHNKGCRYYLGEWRNEKFVPDVHFRMNWNGWDFFAPESVLTKDGRRVMWAWCNLGGGLPIQTGIQSLPRELSLPADGVLRIRPLRELENLRGHEVSASDIRVQPGVPTLLPGVSGDALELRLTIKTGEETECGLRVYTDAAGHGGCPILVDRQKQTLTVGGTTAPFALQPGEDITLRVFLDKNMIEVFANDRQAVVAAHRINPGEQYAAALSTGGEAVVVKMQAWQMRSIYAAR